MVKLKKNTEFTVLTHVGMIPIRVEDHGYLCLNDMVKVYDGKRLDNYFSNESTKELIRAIEARSNSLESQLVNTAIESVVFSPAVIKKEGRYGGTYAHPIIALDCAAWLDVELRIVIYETYLKHMTGRDTWNTSRTLTAETRNLLNASIKEHLTNPPESTNPYAKEAWIIKDIVLGNKSAGDKTAWDNATTEQLEMREYLERIDMGLIIAGLSAHERQQKLKQEYNRKIGD